jgi:hypothetical protein
VRRADGVARDLGLRARSARRSATRRPHAARTFRWRCRGRSRPSTTATLCALLRAQGDAEFETAKVDGAHGDTVHTDRGDLRAPLVVDALGWRRVLSRAEPIQPPEARLSRGLEVHPHGDGDDLELWLDPRYVRAGYSWSFPAGDELRVGVGSFDPRDHVKEPTVRSPATSSVPPCATRATGSRTRCARRRGRRLLRGDSAGPLPADDGRGHPHRAVLRLACGRELRAVRRGAPDARAGARRATPRSAPDPPAAPFDWL